MRITHGEARQNKRTKEYVAWKAMRQRCNDPNFTQFQDYGGRGIRVCERWNSYENFLADMGRKPTPKHCLDRFPDNNGNYELGNCRWATYSQNVNNRRKRTLPLMCRAGLHKMTPDNIIMDGKWRRCAVCRRATW